MSLSLMGQNNSIFVSAACAPPNSTTSNICTPVLISRTGATTISQLGTVQIQWIDETMVLSTTQGAVNDTFTLSWNDPKWMQVFRNGIRQSLNVDFTITGGIIRFLLDSIPQVNTIDPTKSDIVLVSYVKVVNSP